VLAVDDDPRFLEIEQVYLQKHNIDVTPCVSAPKALDEVKGCDYDIIVSDYEMPELNGIDLLKTLRKDGFSMGFILFTGKGREDVAIDALNGGANYYLQKGVDLQSQFTILAGAIDDICRARRSAEALAESERMLRIVNDRLDLLGSITRHDIRGEITVAAGHMDLAEEETDPERIREHLSKARIAIGKVIGITEIARTYQINGAMNVKWDSLGSTLERAVKSVDLERVSFTVAPNGWTILVDPMVEMVCANIFSNSIRHGGKVTRIQVRTEETADGLDLIIEDDGIGVAPEEKERIFNILTPAGVPHGLTIAKRILLAERITIEENGVYGKGASFVLHFPTGLYKTSSRA
jgi:signal transduction histidine kinase